MPVKVGSRWWVSTARTGSPPSWVRLQGHGGGEAPVEGVEDTAPPYLWPGARLGLPAAPPGLMQYLPASIWLGAPGQAWVPGPGGKSF